MLLLSLPQSPGFRSCVGYRVFEPLVGCARLVYVFSLGSSLGLFFDFSNESVGRSVALRLGLWGVLVLSATAPGSAATAATAATSASAVVAAAATAAAIPSTTSVRCL